MTLSSGAKLGSYEIVAPLGAGGMGAVYAAHDPQLDRQVALKVMRGATGEEEDRIRMLREGQAMARVTHPNVITVYEVGTVKEVAGVRTFVSVDGGMSDNLRPMLYDSKYEAMLANKAEADATDVVTIAGKHCESGDVLIERVELPEPRRGDLLAVPVTGAYTLAMSSTSNAVPRPAAVRVAGGEARLIRRRETVGDLLALEA